MIDTLSYRVIWNLFQNRPILNSLAEMKGQILNGSKDFPYTVIDLILISSESVEL